MYVNLRGTLFDGTEVMRFPDRHENIDGDIVFPIREDWLFAMRRAWLSRDSSPETLHDLVVVLVRTLWEFRWR